MQSMFYSPNIRIFSDFFHPYLLAVAQSSKHPQPHILTGAGGVLGKTESEQLLVKLLLSSKGMEDFSSSWVFLSERTLCLKKLWRGPQGPMRAEMHQH